MTMEAVIPDLTGGEMSTISKSVTWRVRLALLCAFVLIITAMTGTPLQAQLLHQQFAEYLNAAQQVKHFSGAVLVAKDHQILFAEGYGVADLSTSQPNTPDTRFLLASITKPFTATAIMQLAERGLLSLDDPIAKYLPDYPKSVAEAVTIYHLLTHTSGIPDYTGLPELDAMYERSVKPDAVVSLFRDLPLTFEPGSEWRYSSSGYYLLGLMIEKVSGLTYGEYMRERIFRPSGMEASDFPEGLIEGPGMAMGYALDSDQNPVPEKRVHRNLPYSAGGLCSTAGDMAKWDQALRDGTLLSQESLALMFTPFKWRYGCGWEIDSLYGHLMVSHGGFGAGFSTHFMRFADEPFCVVVLSNNDAGSIDRMANDLAAIAYGEPYDVPVMRTPVAVDPSLFNDYVGVYDAGPGAHRLVTREGDSLYIQHTGGVRSRLQAEGEDRFFASQDNRVTVSFIRNAESMVTGQIIHHNGRNEKGRRIEGEEAEALLAALVPANVNPAIYDRFVGDYEVAPGFVITLTRRNDQLFIQPTGQPEAEIFPRSETEFFVKAVDALVSFTKDTTGSVSGLILQQGGREIPAKKIK